MLDMRRREEAEGETRMIGLGRREDEESVGFLDIEPGPADGDGFDFISGLELLPDGYPARARLGPRIRSAVFRTWEKS